MASAEFDENSAEKRPAVQVGDPFMEKLLLEACLEVMKTDALIGIQDMGAAGLTCSTCEMGSRGGAGIDIDVAHVPQRETGMTAYEIMLSESQERMLLVVKRGREREVEEIFEKWDLHAAHIGEVTDDGLMRVRERGTVVAEIPTGALTDDAPVYKRPMATPSYLEDVQKLSLPEQPSVSDVDALRALLASPAIASKRWVYRQYDHMVRTNTLVLPGMGAGVVRVKGTNRALALVGRWQRPLLLSRSVPRRDSGGRRSCAKRRVCRRRADRRDQLPEFRQSRAAGDHVAVRARRRRHYGRVQGARHPDYRRQRQPLQRNRRESDLSDAGSRRRWPHRGREQGARPRLQGGGDAIVLLGETRHELGGSEYLKVMHRVIAGVPPDVDLKAERALQQLLVAAHA